MNQRTLKAAFLNTIPVMTGYLFLGIGFGIILQQSGFGLIWSIAMSTFIYAGSMQFVGVGLLTGGAGFAATALTTLMVNARHLFYGLSMLPRYRGMGRARNALVFLLCDETFSINCTAVEDEVANRRFQRSELDWLIYNDPLSYAELILNGDPEEYLRTVTEAPQLDFDS